MFRGKESSNRIELSRLLQELLNFGVSGSLQLWGWVDGGGWMGVGGGWGVPPHTCTHVHTRTHTHAHIHIKHDNFNCKWQPPLGESLGIPYDIIHACACVCMCMCVGGTLSPPPCPHPPTPHPHPPGGWTPRIIQN